MSKQSATFQRYFANAFSVRFSDNDVLIKLAFNEIPTDDDTTEDIAAVVTTLKTAKILAYNLMAIIDGWEKENGEIKVSPEKLQLGKALAFGKPSDKKVD